MNIKKRLFHPKKHRQQSNSASDAIYNRAAKFGDTKDKPADKKGKGEGDANKYSVERAQILNIIKGHR